MKRVLFCAAVLLISLPLLSQQSNLDDLTVEKIMRDPAKWIGTSPSNISWSRDSKSIFFNWNPEQEASSSTYKISIEGGEAVKDEDRLEGFPRQYNFNRDGSVIVYSKGGDIYIREVKSNKETRLTSTEARESDASFHRDENIITYTSNNNLFMIDRGSGFIKQLTNFDIPDDNESPRRNTNSVNRANREQDRWLRNDQLVTSQILRDRRSRPRRSNAGFRQFREDLSTDNLSSIDVPNVRNLQLSGDGKYVTFQVSHQAEKSGKRTIVPNYVTNSGYTTDINARSKVGGEQSYMEIGVYDIENDSSYMVDTEQLEGITDLPDYIRDYPDKSYEKKPRKVSGITVLWSEDGSHCVLQFVSTDYKDRWLVKLDPATGKTETIDRQRDEAWVGWGPGIGRGFGGGTLGFMPDNETLYFQSEASGYSHLYTHNLQNGNRKQLTSGDFEIYNPFLSEDGKTWYLTANVDHPGIRHFYSMPAKGGKLKKITTQDGNNEVTLSPDEKHIAIRYSYSNKPWELYVMENKSGATPRKLTESLTDEFKLYPWTKPENVVFEAEDGAQVHARLYKPENPNGAGVVFVHGAGYLQNAHQWWSGYFREYMFNNILMAKGYTVIDIDYRASAGYGRDWRTAIYRHMGGKDLSDNIDGAKYLIREHGVDPQRVGMYGGSYGGFITLFAMFKHPDVISAGAALRSVTDWAHYNHNYTASILNTPVEDPKAYKRSSPIYFAEGLQGDLLIAHGMVDTNVHFQDVVRLAQKLIELGKDNWEMAVYPVENHGFTTPSGWTDEYKRIFKLFERTIGKK